MMTPPPSPAIHPSPPHEKPRDALSLWREVQVMLTDFKNKNQSQMSLDQSKERASKRSV